MENPHSSYFKRPRLYIPRNLSAQNLIALEPEQVHYLCNVLRLKENSEIRIFNGQDGEWLGTLTDIGKKRADIALQTQLIPQPAKKRKIHLFFSPIKKNRMDWLIEKSIELGATDFHPLLTQNSEIYKINDTRIKRQIIEATEQCERLDLATLHPAINIPALMDQWPINKTPILSCIERIKTISISEQLCKYSPNQDIAVLIGPEGGFTKEEKQTLSEKTSVISLGNNVLRSETAVLSALTLIENI